MLALIMCRELKVLAGNVAQRMYCSKNGHESVGRVAHQELSKKLITQKNAVRNGAKSWDWEMHNAVGFLDRSQPETSDF